MVGQLIIQSGSNAILYADRWAGGPTGDHCKFFWCSQGYDSHCSGDLHAIDRAQYARSVQLDPQDPIPTAAFFGGRIVTPADRPATVYRWPGQRLDAVRAAQAMQLYALGTGGFLAGANAILVFGLGTVPLLFAFGTLNSLLSRRFTRGMLRTSAVLVCVLGLIMVSRGLVLAGVAVSPGSLVSRTNAASVARIEGGVQVVKTVVENQSYSPRLQVIQKGIPVRWVIEARSLNGCNDMITIPELGIKQKLVPGRNVVQFTPKKEGTLTYSCWMGMITGGFRVVKYLSRTRAGDIDRYIRDENSSNAGTSNGCCGPVPPKFRGGRIPVDELAVAKIVDGEQRVQIKVNDEGFVPAAFFNPLIFTIS